jgi:hypothetical protein
VDPAGSGNAGFAGWTYTSDSVAERTGNVVVGVRRTGGSTGELSVDYNTVAGTAVAPGDFTPTFGTLTWPSGDVDPKSITVPITSDSTAENDEYFTIALTNSTNGLAASEFRATITEMAPPPPPPPPPPSPPPPLPHTGGGATGIELLMFLAMIAASANRRRSGRYRTVAETP